MLTRAKELRTQLEMNERGKKGLQQKLLQPLLSQSITGVKRKADTSISDSDSDDGDDLTSLEECCIDAIIDFLSTDGLPKLKEIIKEAVAEYEAGNEQCC